MRLVFLFNSHSRLDVPSKPGSGQEGGVSSKSLFRGRLPLDALSTSFSSLLIRCLQLKKCRRSELPIPFSTDKCRAAWLESSLSKGRDSNLEHCTALNNNNKNKNNDNNNNNNHYAAFYPRALSLFTHRHRILYPDRTSTSNLVNSNTSTPKPSSSIPPPLCAK